jgi:hypothetical protein
MNSADTWNPWPSQEHNYTGPPTSWNFCELSADHYKVQGGQCPPLTCRNRLSGVLRRIEDDEQ